MMEGDEKKLAQLHPALASLARRHFNVCIANGVQFRITQGFRSPEQQAALWAKGRNELGHIVDPKEVVTNAPPWRSWHQFGLAYDVVLVLPTGEVSWDVAIDGDADGIRDWQEIGVAGESVGLEWGGRWKKLKDCPHFQLTRGLSYEVAQSLLKSGGIPADYFA